MTKKHATFLILSYVQHDPKWSERKKHDHFFNVAQLDCLKNYFSKTCFHFKKNNNYLPSFKNYFFTKSFNNIVLHITMEKKNMFLFNSNSAVEYMSHKNQNGQLKVTEE